MTTKQLTFDKYKSERALNWSSLKELRRSPLHYQWSQNNPRPDSDTLIVGRAGHTAILEPLRFLREYAMWTGKIRRGKEWEQFKSDNDGKTIIREQDFASVELMAQAVHNHPEAMDLLSGCQVERSVFWDYKGRPCKARLDAFKDGYLVDVKTTSDLSRFTNDAYKFGYHGQLAFYGMALAAVMGMNVDTYILAVESKPPHDVGVFKCSTEFITEGEQLVFQLIDRLEACERADSWPGSMPEVAELKLPAWAKTETEDEPIDFGTELLT